MCNADIMSHSYKIFIFCEANLLCVSEDEAIILCALESERNSYIISQAKAFEVSRQGAPQTELSQTRNLDRNMVVTNQFI